MKVEWNAKTYAAIAFVVVAAGFVVYSVMREIQ